MLKRIFLATMLVPAVASAQTGTFTITGNIGKLDKPAKVYIDYTSDNGKGGEDSAVLVNGQFKLTGKLVGNASARLALDHEGKGKGFSVYSPGADVIYFYFGAENVKIASKDSLYNATFSGSKVYNEFVAYKKYIGGSIMELSRDYQQAYMEASDEDKRDAEFMQAMNSRFEARRKARAEKVLEFAKNNPKSYFALAGLSELADKGNAAVTKPIWDALSKELKATDMGKELGLRMASINITKVGQPAPAFTQNDVDGKPLALASLKGKVVLIDFWASWCSPAAPKIPICCRNIKSTKTRVSKFFLCRSIQIKRHG
ncbi:AhpC/TSA family protein [Chitinophaga sedimenti]|nr:TlpA disulfide reductase family protein [Chitinophaga sedimenti]MCK7557110.1 AhpC/TSA family protein [Chitinophaga sedimenti]